MPRTRRQSELHRRRLVRDRLRQLRVVEEIADNNLHSIENPTIQRRSSVDSNTQRSYNSIWRNNRRQDPEFRQQEQQRDTREHQARRTNASYRQMEQIRDTERHQERRTDTAYRQMEQIRDTERHQERRTDTGYRQMEQIRDTERHQERRTDPSYREEEQLRNTVEHRIRRDDPVYREEERIRNTLEHRFRRSDTSYRMEEQVRNTMQHQTRRSNSYVQGLERSQNTLRRSIRRQNMEYRALEQQQDTIRRQVARQYERQTLQNIQRGINERVVRYRQTAVNRTRENTRQAERMRQTRQELPAEEIEVSRDSEAHSRISRFNRYNTNIKQGPTIICTCCGGLWFQHQVEQISKDQIHVSTEFINDVFCLSERFPSSNNKFYFCKTCSRSVKNKRRPNIRLSNGLDFPDIPECLKDLTSFKERLVTVRFPFMRIVAIGFERQSTIRGLL